MNGSSFMPRQMIEKKLNQGRPSDIPNNNNVQPVMITTADHATGP
jgi:hypothetical protein